METTKMTVRVRKDLLEKAKRYAQENDTTLTNLVAAYFEALSLTDDPLSNAPTVRRLVGSLSPAVSVENYQEFLAKKYE